MSLKLRCWCVLLGLLAAGQGLAAPAPAPTRHAFRAYGREQGLGNITVALLLQDRRGLVWAGTDDGLYRYDGARFQLFGAAQGLRSTLVNVLHLDRGGDIWVGTDRGLARLRGDRFEMMGHGLPQEAQIEDLANGPDRELWVATRKGILYGTADKGFRVSATWGERRPYALCASADGRQVYAAARQGLFRLEPGGAWVAVDPGGQAGLEGIERLLLDSTGRLWARTPKGLFMMASGDSRLRPIRGVPPAESSRSRMFEDAQGGLWFPTEKGLASLVNEQWHHLGLGEGLPMDFARAALVDHEGTLWVGSHGLFRTLGRGLWRSAGPKESLPVPVWSFLRDARQTLWAGTQKGLARHTSQGWEVVPGTEAMGLRSVRAGPDGAVFMAGDAGRLLRFDPGSRRLTSLQPPFVNRQRILQLLPEPDGALWIATRGAGLILGRPVGNGWHYERVQLPHGDEKERIYSLHRDRKGALWAAGDRGLACLSGGQWRRFTKRDGLLEEAVTYLAETPAGDLWVAYLEPIGITRIRPQGEHLQVMQTLGPDLGFASLEIYLLGLDASGRLWVGSNKGLDILDRPESARPAVWHQGIEDGLVDEDTDAMAFLAEPNGDVWIGTRGGLGQFLGGSFTGAPLPPATVLLSGRLGKTSLIGPRDTLFRVPYRENTLEVKFAAVSYTNEAALQQQVWLEGLEHEWIFQGNHDIRYPGLAHGDYRLHLRSRLGQGPWGQELVVAFRISPPWWQTWWFRAVAGLALAAGAYTVVRWRSQALRRHNEELAGLVEARTLDLAKRTLELEQANQSLENLSLTDPLTGLRNRRFLDLTITEDVAQVNRTHREATASLQERTLLNIDLIFLMVDLDHFKKVNDDYGHGAGDQVLQQLAMILRNATRESDTTIRWGGEEFLVVARNACRSEAAILAERIRSQMEKHPFDLGDGRTIRLTCSIGFTFYPLHPGSPVLFSWEQVVELADRSLYAAKRGGRNAWVGICPATNTEPAQLSQRLPLQLDQLIQDGLLQVNSSLPTLEHLDWGSQGPDQGHQPG